MNRLDSSRTAIKSAAFTRMELIFTMVAVVAITLVLTACASRVDQQNALSRCKDNLKNVALALHLWLEDNDVNCHPWDLNNRAVTASDPRRSECWFQMMFLS